MSSEFSGELLMILQEMGRSAAHITLHTLQRRHWPDRDSVRLVVPCSVFIHNLLTWVLYLLVYWLSCLAMTWYTMGYPGHRCRETCMLPGLRSVGEAITNASPSGLPRYGLILMASPPSTGVSGR